MVLTTHDSKSAALFDFYHRLLGRAVETNWRVGLSDLYTDDDRVLSESLSAPFEP